MRSAFVSKLVTKPWNIDKLRGRTILASIALSVLRNNTPARSERPAQDQWGDPLPTMELVGTIARIPLTGIIDINVPCWLKELGLNLTDANDIGEEIQQALADPDIELLMFDVDSPGGSALSGEKLFALVQAANKTKPCFAFCGDGCDMASTAYLAVAACDAIFAGPHADGVGCIGSYLAYLDDTDFWAQMGMKWEVFRSGELKGIGEDALSPEQRNYLQSLVDTAGATFRRSVLKYRTGINPADMRGQWFNGAEAVKRGFVTANVNDLQAAIAKAKSFSRS
jgi:capsid assembly protease